MRYLACTGILLLCLAGAALAQEDIAPPPAAETRFVPAYEQRVGHPLQVPLVPTRVLDRLISGSSLVCCTPRADRSLECAVVFEAPEREGMGGMALAIMETRQLTEASFAEYNARSERGQFWQTHIVRMEGRPAPPLPPREERDALCRAAAAD
jgi:hypothetical protein